MNRIAVSSAEESVVSRPAEDQCRTLDGCKVHRVPRWKRKDPIIVGNQIVPISTINRTVPLSDDLVIPTIAIDHAVTATGDPIVSRASEESTRRIKENPDPI